MRNRVLRVGSLVRVVPGNMVPLEYCGKIGLCLSALPKYEEYVLLIEEQQLIFNRFEVEFIQ